MIHIVGTETCLQKLANIIAIHGVPGFFYRETIFLDYIRWINVRKNFLQVQCRMWLVRQFERKDNPLLSL